MDVPTGFAFWLTQAFFDGEGRAVEFDDFQVILDPYNKQIRINLSGEQVDRLLKWDGLKLAVTL